MFSLDSSKTKKEELKQQIRSEFALANAQELINKMSEKCYTGCVSKPGKSLGRTETDCLSKCMKKYLEAWNMVSQAYTRRIQEESVKGSK
ncbi:protein translocase subunit [Dispira simplex]|nr:protein translocase subunit [Dispira simplex]